MNFKRPILPLLFVIVVVLIIAFQNITPNTYFSGWDNMHPEWNLSEYSKRVFFGAWVEFQGTGAPAAQSQLAEIPRLPFLYLLKLIFPDNLVRYAFHFFMFLIGGIGIYFYLKKIWLTKTKTVWRDWIAGFGAIFYLLNIITLEKFYISFECFAVQFAYLPFVFMSIHDLSEDLNPKTVLKFIVVQLLICPYAYLPSLFYITVFFFLAYGFFVNLQIHKIFSKALKKTLIIALLTFVTNAFWLLPNLYYTIHNASYVNLSRANQLFDVEALWSVREAGILTNFLTGIHYIFDWKDLSFQNLQYQFIYQDWVLHLSNKLTILLISLFNIFTFAGFCTLVFDKKRGVMRWGFIIMFFLTTILIWNGLLLPTPVFKFMFSFEVVLSVFRNLFTKLSNIYGFAIAVLLAYYYEHVLTFLRSKKSIVISYILPIILLSASFIAVIYIAWPSFQGNFINDKLKINIPQEYFDMFSYLKTKPANQRILELPFYSQSGWVYFDWSTDKKANGYQGMGFYFFGFPQALLTPDHARWTESTDFFYHELRHALNSTNSYQFKKVLEKYNVDLILVDKTAINPANKPYNFQKNDQMLSEANYSKIWQKNFLSIYEKQNIHKVGKLIVPRQISFISAKTERVRQDYAYENVGEYIKTTDKKADILFPFIDFNSLYVNDAVFQDDRLSIERNIPIGNYTIKIPGLKNNIYSTDVFITYKSQALQIVFPKTKIKLGNNEVILPQLKNIFIPIKKNYDFVVLTVNDQRIVINNNQTLYSQISVDLNQSIQLSLLTNDSNSVVDTQQPLWEAWQEDVSITTHDLEKIKIETIFPKISADLKKFRSENCSQPERGTIETYYKQNSLFYSANDFGVNCNHYTFDSLTPSSSHLMQITGENINGRNIKFFLSSNVSNSIREDYLMPEKKYKLILSILPITAIPQSRYSLNWETRSYGKTAQNILSDISIMPLQLDRLSQIQLQKKANQSPLINKIMVNKVKPYFNFVYFIGTECKSVTCYIGIDQSFDDLWIAFGKNLQILPHYRYNNWANLWQIEGSQKIVVVYIPELVSLISIFFLITVILILLIKSKKL